MNSQSILTDTQKKFLELFGSKTLISDQFYLTGGTALAGFYIPYRFSEDLDFFSEKEINMQGIIIFIKSIKKIIKYKTIDISTTFNRNLIFLEFTKSQTLKTEFTYFPFPQIEKPKKKCGLRIDSIIDIAVNKLFTIYQNPRSRDFMDLYKIIQKYEFTLSDLIKKARIKFDWNIDYIQLGTQFMQVKELKDYPQLIKPMKEEEWQAYFIFEAKKFKEEILE